MNRQVLVVDDDPDVLITTEVVLECAGYTVTTALSGTSCLAAVRKGFKGVILLDVMMPGMDGWTVVRKMAEEGYIESNAVCMLSAMYSPDPIPAEYRPYVKEYIRKPYDPDQLIKTIEHLLSSLESRST